VAHVGQEIDAFGAMRLRLIQTGGELLEMEATYTGEAGMPPEHLHPIQAERFEIVLVRQTQFECISRGHSNVPCSPLRSPCRDRMSRHRAACGPEEPREARETIAVDPTLADQATGH